MTTYFFGRPDSLFNHCMNHKWLWWCRTNDDVIVSEARGRCRSFWLTVSSQRRSDSDAIDDAQLNSNELSWRRRRCPVARLRKRTSPGRRITRQSYEECSSTNCFFCYRREQYCHLLAGTVRINVLEFMWCYLLLCRLLVKATVSAFWAWYVLTTVFTPLPVS